MLPANTACQYLVGRRVHPRGQQALLRAEVLRGGGRRAVHHARGVEYQIQAAVALGGVRHHAIGVRRTRQIRNQGMRLAAVRADVIDGRPCLRLLDVDADDARAFPRGANGGTAADAAYRRAGDEHHLAGEPAGDAGVGACGSNVCWVHDLAACGVWLTTHSCYPAGSLHSQADLPKMGSRHLVWPWRPRGALVTERHPRGTQPGVRSSLLLARCGASGAGGQAVTRQGAREHQPAPGGGVSAGRCGG